MSPSMAQGRRALARHWVEPNGRTMVEHGDDSEADAIIVSDAIPNEIEIIYDRITQNRPWNYVPING